MADHRWSGLTAVGKVVRVREMTDKTTTETAYYLLSTAMAAERFGEVVRSHWAVENRLHWCLDVTMNEDQARNRMDHSPQNLPGSQGKLKGSLRKKLRRASWSDTFLATVLAQL
jgi:predicted transposase YbfD/YdcC